MKHRILKLCDYAAYYRIDVGFFFLALIGSVLIALGSYYGWLIAVTFLSLFVCVAAFGDSSTHPVKNSNERVAKQLAQGFSLQSIEGEPLPPWLEAPGADPFDIVWRMSGETYVADFFTFFQNLDGCEKQAYFARYDLGTRWPHRRQWYEALFDPSEVDKA